MINLKDLINQYEIKQKRYYKNFKKLTKKFHHRPFLKKREVYKILYWKLYRRRRDYHLKNFNDENKPSEVITATKLAFSSKDDESKVNYLDNLKQVGVPVASAILTVWNPKRYGVIDDYVVKAIEKHGRKLNIGRVKLNKNKAKDYVKYLDIIRKIGSSRKPKLTAREVDMALFMLGKKK